MQTTKFQPGPVDGALGRFSEASVLLAGDVSDRALQRHVQSLSAITGSDLVLLYENAGSGDYVLTGAHGLAPGRQGNFRRLDRGGSYGAGNLRAFPRQSGPIRCAPLTRDLTDLGIRACWAYPLWQAGDLLGQAFFGSRQWDEFHGDTLSVLALAANQFAHALRQRRLGIAAKHEPVSWGEDAGAIGIAQHRRFIAVLAHELRNPIAPIRSALDLMSTSALDDRVRRETVQMMQRQLMQLVRLIDDLLDTVRLSTGKLRLKREHVLLKEVVAAAIESIRPALRAKRQALALDDGQAAVVVDVDPVRLAQAFGNILSANARQTPEEGVLTVAIEVGATELTVTFQDEGPGVDAADLAQVFELFPMSAADQADDGLGIGLGLVKGLVELNRGRVEVRNRPGRTGAEYVVTLPWSATPADAPEPRPSQSAADWISHRLLIVDDNRDAAEMLGLHFELDGYTIRLAHDGPSAVAMAVEFQPEIIIMDIGLPGFNGVEAANRIRARNASPEPFIVALTGWGADSDRKATKDAGIDLHLVKPVSHAELQEALRRALEARRSND